MRKSRFIPFVAALVVLFGIFANVKADSQTTTRLYYTAKVWGYLKYFHPLVNGVDKNMDSILLALIPEIEAATDDASFNVSLAKMFAFAGPMPIASGPPVIVPDSEIIDVNTDWQSASMFSTETRAFLESVRANFRPAESYYYQVNHTGSGGQFFVGELDYDSAVSLQEPYRLLTLFRAWNIYNYFSPYKKLLDQAWDSTLAEIIPLVRSAGDALSFHLALRRFQARQQDSHSGTGSSVLNAHFGSHVFPFLLSTIEGKTVVSKVYSGETRVKAGDVVESIDGTSIQTIRDSLRQYTKGGSQAIIERNIDRTLTIGVDTMATLVLNDGTGSRTAIEPRNSNGYEASDSTLQWRGDGALYKLMKNNIGYVNCGILMQTDLQDIVDSLWKSSAIIFDVRNYPPDFSVITTLGQKLLQTWVSFVQYRGVSTKNPGTVSYSMDHIGSSNNPDWYRGKVIVLVNENTESRAEFFTMALQACPNAMVVGSHTSGNDGNVMSVYYPTGITMNYSGLGVYYPDGTPSQRVGIHIDVPVEPTILGIRTGRDELLEKAIEVASASGVKKTITALGQIELSPNPTNGIITVHNLPEDLVSVTVMNILGERVLAFQNLKSLNLTVDLSKLISGIYFITFHGENFTTTRKIVRQ
ncbi:MAG: T9SS type A sorting domain-containing protein [Ignavibacteriota bacterium]